MNEDQTIIQEVRNGDYDAFELLVEKYQGRIYRHIRKMVKDASEVQDILQETFLNVYKGLNSYQGDASFSTWLFKVASNTALMYLRKKRPEMLQYEDELKTVERMEVTPASPEFVSTPLEILLSREGRMKIEEAIDQLPLTYRTVIILRDVEGFSLEEVADIVDSSVPAVKSRLHRGRHFIRENLSSYYTDRAGSKKSGSLSQ